MFYLKNNYNIMCFTLPIEDVLLYNSNVIFAAGGFL